MIEEELAQLTARLSSMGLRVNELEGAIDWHMGEDSAGSNSFGSHTMGAFSAIVVGQVTDYDNGNGFWVDFQGNTSRLFIGSSAGNKLTWDGTTLAVTGTLTATLGVIGGWTIGATTLTGSGTGALVLTSGPTTASIRSGQTAYDTGTGFYLEANTGGAGSPRFSIGNSAGDKLTFDGSAMTLTGRLNFGTGDYIDNDLIHFEVGLLAATMEWYNGASTPFSKLEALGSATAATVRLSSTGLAARATYLDINSNDADATCNFSLMVSDSAGLLSGITADGGTGPQVTIKAQTNPIAAFTNTNRMMQLYGYLYLGTGAALQTTRYFTDDGTRSEFFGGNLRFTQPAGLLLPTKAGVSSDSDYTDDADGQTSVDTTNGIFAFRANGAWRIPKQKLDQKTSTTTVVNTTTETTIYSKSIPANLLGTTGALDLSLDCDYLNDTGGTDTFTLRVKFGSTTMFNDITAAIAGNAARRKVELRLRLLNMGATNAQNMWGHFQVDPITAATSGQGDLGAVSPLVEAEIDGTASEDTTAAKTLDVTIQHTSASGSIQFRCTAGILEVER